MKKGARSVSRGAGFSVSASPFNQVKLELGIALVVGLLLLLVSMRMTGFAGAALLLIYSVAASLWLVVRTRKVLHREIERMQEGEDGA